MSLTLVIGTAGAGKSALLREFVIRGGAGIDFAIHLRNLTTDDFVTRLAEAFSLALPPGKSGGPAAQELLVRRVGELPGRRRKRPLIVADSLDEAREHSRSIANLLGILGARADVIVGLRTGHERRLVGALRPAVLIDLDSEEYFHPEDVRGFVLRLFEGEGRFLPNDVRESAVTAICEAAGRNFLIAGLLTLARLQAHASGESWDDHQLPANVAGAMRVFVERLPDPERAWDLLLPPALSQGEGWPVYLWPAAVKALTGTACSDEEIAAFRRSAAEYLIEQAASPSERTVRLYHDALSMAVLAERVDRARAWTTDPLEARRIDQQAITKALLGTVSEQGWSNTSYVRLHLPQHAEASGDLPELLEDVHFLCHVDPRRLQLAVAGDPQLRSRPAVISHAFVLHLMSDDANRNASLLRMAALYHGFDHLAAQVDAANLGIAPAAIWFGQVMGSPRSSGAGHSDWVTAVTAFRATGSWRIATASADRTIKIWDSMSESTRPVATLSGHTDCVRDVFPIDLGRDTGLVTASDDGSVRLWRLTNRDGAEYRSLQGHTDWVRSVRVYRGAEGVRVVSAGDDGTVRIWDPEAEEPAVRSFTGHSGWILALCIISTEEGPRILSGGADGRVLVWDPEGQSDAPLCSLDYHNGVVRALTAYERPEGWRIVSAGDDRVLHIWSFEDPGQHQKIDCYTRSIRGVAAFRSRSGWALVTGSADQLVRVHELDERDQVRETQILRGHNDWVRGVCAIQVPTGEGVSLATGSDDGSLKLWSYPATSTNPLRSYEDNRTWLRAVCVAGSGQASRVAAAGADGRIHFWKLGGSRAPQQSLSGHPSWVRALLILPSADPEDCRLVSAGDDGSVRLWNPLGKTPGHPQILRSGSTPIRALAHFDMNGEDWLAAVGDEGLVYIWALDRPESSLRSLKGSTDWLRTVCAFREGPRWLIAAGGDDRVLRVWDPVLPTEEPVAEHQGHTDSLRALCAIPGANEPLLVSTSDDGTLRTWNWREGEARCVQGHKGSGLALCARSIGQRWSVVSASADQSVKIWCAHTLMLLAEVPTLSPNFAVAAYGPDTLAVGNQRGLLWIDLVDRRDSH